MSRTVLKAARLSHLSLDLSLESLSGGWESLQEFEIHTTPVSRRG
ncbi:MAG: hypothetical protein PVH30_13500 [Desulfobacterales bacterium]